MALIVYSVFVIINLIINLNLAVIEMKKVIKKIGKVLFLLFSLLEFSYITELC